MMTSGTGEKSKVWRAVAAVVIVIVVLGGVVYIHDKQGSSGASTSTPVFTVGSSTTAALSSSSSSAAALSNLLLNGGFATGNLTGWQNTSSIEPFVSLSGLSNMTFAATFETPPNGNDLASCTQLNAECGVLNVSTIHQKLVMGSVTRAFNFSLALNPSFSYPAGLQITLAWQRPSDPDAQNATIFYLFYTSAQQCTDYSNILSSYNLFHTTIYCLTVPQGEWTTVTRNISHDLSLNVGNPAYLDGSTLTLSISFAGANATDKLSVGSVFFG